MKYLYLIFILIPFLSFSQEKEKSIDYSFLSINLQRGTVLPTNSFLKGENLAKKPIDDSHSISIKYGWQNPEYSDWQKIYHRPYYGGGIYVATFHNSVELGIPISIFGFIGIPITRIGKFELYNELQFGVSSNWKVYDEVKNPKNIAIGSNLTAYINIGLNAFYRINNHFNIGASISFTHFSNGGTIFPNQGINMYSPSIELRYNINGNPINKPKQFKEQISLEKKNHIDIMISYGQHEKSDKIADINYKAFVLGTYYYLQHTYAFRSGAGFDIGYTQSSEKYNRLNDYGVLSDINLGLIYQPELVFSKVIIGGGIGIYAIHNRYGNFKKSYQKLGIKYNFIDNIFLGLNVRAIEFSKAEYLELNLTYSFNLKKN